MLNDLGGARLAKFRSVAQKGAHEFIPSSCIWAKETFSTWLASENEGRDLWEESVFPQMKNILNEVTNDSFEEEQNLRKNTFELFGADFMIDEKLNVFLLEINKSPDPAANTKIQRRLFEGIASDTIKVNFLNHFSWNFINYTKLPIRHFSWINLFFRFWSTAKKTLPLLSEDLYNCEIHWQVWTMLIKITKTVFVADVCQVCEQQWKVLDPSTLNCHCLEVSAPLAFLS